MRVGFWLTTPRRFDPEQVWETPFGGAEISALLLAKELAYLDYAEHDVYVYGNCTYKVTVAVKGIPRGIYFCPYRALSDSSLDLLIIKRADPNLINPRRSGLLYGKELPPMVLWTGDAADQPNNQAIFHDSYCLKQLELILPKTNWQAGDLRRHFPLIPKEKIHVMYNGVDSAAVKPRQKIDKPRFVYASTAYRGLHRFLAIWPMIKERIPDAELDCYCKTTLYLEDNPRDTEWQGLYNEISELPGVAIKEPVPHKQFIRRLAGGDNCESWSSGDRRVR
jgi:glycosyltransferase involved in cell wall biosynthesis